MIERYTIKFPPLVSQKELAKVLHEATNSEELKKIKKMKARIEFIGEIEDMKKISDYLKDLSRAVI